MITLLSRLLFLAILAVGGYFLWKYLDRRAKKKTPVDILQEAIESQTAGLHAAMETLRASESYVRQLAEEVAAREKDVQGLDNRARGLAKEGRDEQASVVIQQLEAKERDLEKKKAQHAKALQDHQGYSQTVDELRQSIHNLKQETNELQIRSKLARTEQQAATLAAAMQTGVDSTGLQSAREQLEEQIVQAKAEAQLNRDLTQGSSTEDEYLKEATAEQPSSVAERLARYKQEQT